ncbi:MAG: hypothetical protein GY717_11190 [Rhodobacteraceae bacterium]|nr:hypothetical protein [Paracoccaceae bacterium]
MVAETEQIDHEPLPLQLASRQVFRNSDALHSHLGRMPELQRFFVRLENLLRTGNRHVNCGWPTFAWLEYMSKRYVGHFRFIHLVRNPYDCAASHATHQPMLAGKLSTMEKRCKLFGTDPNLKFKQFADRYDRFGTFERQLLHWLEVTTYFHEHSNSPGYRGAIRFEDLVASDNSVLNGLMCNILGRQVQSQTPEPFDRVHRPFPWQVEFDVDPELREKVDALATRIGYSQQELDQSMNAERLQETYSARRFDLPCDPRISVTADK